MKKNAIFFDFDGVILDSVHVKTKSFATIFKKYGPEIERQVVDYHIAHGGISRFEKFRYFYENLLQQPITSKQLIKLGEKFSSLTFSGVVDSHFIDGALETLEFLKKKNILSFIVSGTPQTELKEIVKIKKISHYFAEIHGSPTTKYDIIQHLITQFKLENKRCLFIGDAMTDYDAALSVGIDFLGIVPPTTKSPFPNGTNHCTSLFFLQKMLNEA